jgi:hypothetical protein
MLRGEGKAATKGSGNNVVWTDEKRQAARDRMIERNRQKKEAATANA